MIAAISPSGFNYNESVTTLRYAARANAIKNIPKVNEDPKDALLKQYEEELKKLREQVGSGMAPSAFDNDEMFKQLENEKNKINEEKQLMEKNLREKDEMLHNTNQERELLMKKLRDMERDMEKKLVVSSNRLNCFIKVMLF